MKDRRHSVHTNSYDKECVALCKAINRFPGIRTTQSCCGHGETRYAIWFRVNNLEALPPLLYFFDGCHCGSYDWRVIVYTDCAMSPVVFEAEDPVGKKAYKEARVIAKLMTDYLD